MLAFTAAEHVADGRCGRLDLRHIHRAIVARRGANTDECQIRGADFVGHLARAAQLPRRQPGGEEFGQPRLENRALTRIERRHPLGEDIEARHVVVGGGKRRSRDESDVASSHDCNAHRAPSAVR